MLLLNGKPQSLSLRQIGLRDTFLSPGSMRLPANLPTKFRSPQVEALVGALLGGNRRIASYSYREMESALINNPPLNAACEVRIALTLAALGGYTHDSEEIQAEVNRAIANYKGNFQDDISRILSYLPYGFSYTEVAHQVTRDGGAALKGFRTLNQVRTGFKTGKSEIETVEYQGQDTDVVAIPYETGIHLTNQPYLLLSNNAKGLSIMDRVMPFYEAYNLLLAALVIAGQRQATPILVGKTDTSTPSYLLNPDGTQMISPSTGLPVMVYQGDQMRDKLEEVQNGSVLVIDRLDEVMAIVQQTSGEMLLNTLDFLTRMMLLGFLIPTTTVWTSPSGVGDAGLAKHQGEVVQDVIRRDVAKLADALVEKAIKPEIIWNHGEQDSYGSFPVKEKELLEASQMIMAIAGAVRQGALSGSEPEAAERIKKLAGIN